MAVLPCLDLVISWNDANARVVDDALDRLYDAASTVPAASPPEVGPALRARKLAGNTLRLTWAGDEGAPRASGEHYHVLRGTHPLALDLAAGSHPRAVTQFDELPDGEPLVFYQVVAASACEQVSED